MMPGFGVTAAWVDGSAADKVAGLDKQRGDECNSFDDGDYKFKLESTFKLGADAAKGTFYGYCYKFAGADGDLAMCDATFVGGDYIVSEIESIGAFGELKETEGVIKVLAALIYADADTTDI